MKIKAEFTVSGPEKETAHESLNVATVVAQTRASRPDAPLRTWYVRHQGRVVRQVTRNHDRSVSTTVVG